MTETFLMLRGVDMHVKLSRWTPFVFFTPNSYVTDAINGDFDFESWSEDFEWRQDRFNGWLDIAKPPVETVSDGWGDCEDYALVAASAELARNRYRPVPHHLSIAFCFPRYSPIPRHVVCYTSGDDYTRVYSSGAIHEDTNMSDYIEMSPYTRYIRRRIK